jgi:hypothetical protein
MACLLSSHIEGELDDVWRYIASESSSVEVANRVVDSRDIKEVIR